MSNLSLWESVERTDPRHVKPITGKQYSGNSPKPHWLVLKATETFGPCGIGWGFSITDSRFVTSEDGIMHFATVRVWFKWNGERGEVEHVGGTPFAGKRSSGRTFSDEDAPKKSVTDALVKALSMIGFAGDIFLGRWDDSKYQAELREEFSERAAPSTAKAAKAQLKALSDHIDRTGRSVDRLLKHYGVAAIEDLTANDAAAAIEMLCGIADKAKAA
jgi:hypothetical protein